MSQTSETDRAMLDVTEILDRLSLEQSLIDVEVANARVVDLTSRLTEAHVQNRQLQQQVAEIGAELAARPAPVGLRGLVAGPVKAVARRILPLSVRVRIRSAVR